MGRWGEVGTEGLPRTSITSPGEPKKRKKEHRGHGEMPVEHDDEETTPTEIGLEWLERGRKRE